MRISEGEKKIEKILSETIDEKFLILIKIKFNSLNSRNSKQIIIKNSITRFIIAKILKVKQAQKNQISKTTLFLLIRNNGNQNEVGGHIQNAKIRKMSAKNLIYYKISIKKSKIKTIPLNNNWENSLQTCLTRKEVLHSEIIRH
jgi:hypothetical protein